jgi:hypothetical protein
MSDNKRSISRGKMSVAERTFRSKLAQAVAQRGLLRGSLLVRRRVCGKARCKCARGQLHESLYLVITQGGRTRQLYVPKAWEGQVRQWVQEYRQIRRLLEELSQIYWDKVRNRED